MTLACFERNETSATNRDRTKILSMALGWFITRHMQCVGRWKLQNRRR